MKRTSVLALRRFLASPEGVEFVQEMRGAIPGISPGTSDEIIFGAGISEGWRRCLSTIIDKSTIDNQPDQDLENK